MDTKRFKRKGDGEKRKEKAQKPHEGSYTAERLRKENFRRYNFTDSVNNCYEILT